MDIAYLYLRALVHLCVDPQSLSLLHKRIRWIFVSVSHRNEVCHSPVAGCSTQHGPCP